MDDPIAYSPRWTAHLATNEAPETPLYTVASEPRVVEALANREIAKVRTVAQIEGYYRERAS